MSATYPVGQESLWWLVAAPAVWAVHFLASYFTAAVWCARLAVGSELGLAGWAIAVYTVVALLLIAAVGLRSVRRVGRVPDHVGHDLDEPGARHRFLAFSGLLLAGLSAVAVLYEALVPVLVGTCL